MKLKQVFLNASDHDTLGAMVETLEMEDVDRRSLEEMRTKANPIGVATYELQSKLPPAMKGKLPSARQLRAAVCRVLPEGEAVEAGK
jgi:hypothetical protein